MANTRIIPIPKDAPPGTLPTFRELISRVYEIERLNGSNQSAALADSKGLGSTVQSLSGQVSDLNSRYVVYSNGDFYTTTGAIPSNSTFYEFGSEMTLNVESPGEHKQVVITVGAAEISMDCNPGDTLIGEIAWRWSGTSYGSYFARIYLAGDQRIGLPVIASRSFRLPAGVYGVRAKIRGWSGTGGSNTSNFTCTQPYLNAEVIGADSAAEYNF